MCFVKLNKLQTRFIELGYTATDPTVDGGIVIYFQAGLEIRLSLIEAIQLVDDLNNSVELASKKLQSSTAPE